MKDLRPVRGLHHLLDLIAQGEHVQQDFKYLISDARKIARSISAFANNSGGRLIIGVRDNGTIAGVRSEEDLYMIEQAAQRYCDPEVEVNFSAIKAGHGVVVYIASIPQAHQRPVSVIESNGVRQAYYRVRDENIVAHPIMVSAWQQLASSEGHMITLTDTDGKILQYLSTVTAGADPQEIAVTLHLSSHLTTTSLTRLATLGLIEFRYDGHQFKIHFTEAEDL